MAWVDPLDSVTGEYRSAAAVLGRGFHVLSGSECGGDGAHNTDCEVGNLSSVTGIARRVML